MKILGSISLFLGVVICTQAQIPQQNPERAPRNAPVTSELISGVPIFY